MTSRAKKIIFARVDRIGDLLLTLPVEQAWRGQRPHDEIQWVVSQPLDFIMDHYQSSASSLLVPATRGFRESLKKAKTWAQGLRHLHADAIVCFHVPWWLALAAWWARIPVRVGVWSQWYSWLFFNSGLRQKRSRGDKHESQYNLELAQWALRQLAPQEERAHLIRPISLKVASSTLEVWHRWLTTRGLKKFVVIHPGMGGSARNWNPHSYQRLALGLIQHGVGVVVTGGGTDRDFILQTGLLSIPQVVSLVNETAGGDLLAVLSLAKAVVAPSTGVAHMAAAVGTPVVGLYSPVRVQAPRRWAPLGDQVQVLVPQVPCPGTMECLHDRCPLYDCMDTIEVENVLDSVMEYA